MVLEEAGGDNRGGSRAVQAVVGEDGVAVQGDLLGMAAQVSGDAGRGDGQAPRRGPTPPLTRSAEALGAISRAVSRSETIKGDRPRELGNHKNPPGPPEKL